MIGRPVQHWPIPAFLLPNTNQTLVQRRCLHHRMPAPKIPRQTPFVPDTQTFLTLIGRNLSQYAPKFPSWEALFSMTSVQLKELGIEPPRNRKYLLRWREKFRKGEYGIGGDIKHVKDGQAELHIAEVPSSRTVATATTSLGMKKIIINTPPGKQLSELQLKDFTPVKGLKLRGARTIAGPYVQPAKGDPETARLVIQEGMWEHRRGHKIDGGERRQAEVRAKKRSEERKR